MSALTATVSPELKALMRRLRLGRLLDTLPARVALARTHNLPRVEFLEQLFADEVTRRDADSAGFGPGSRTSTRPWCSRRGTTRPRSPTTEPWSELVSLRFVAQARNALILGPVGVGKTLLATTLGHIACGSRCTSSGPTSCSSVSRRRAWTPATTPRCASSSASSCW